jgi:hypothetical protein
VLFQLGNLPSADHKCLFVQPTDLFASLLVGNGKLLSHTRKFNGGCVDYPDVPQVLAVSQH